MSEPLRLAAEAVGPETLEASGELEASRDFETFYEAESQGRTRSLEWRCYRAHQLIASRGSNGCVVEGQSPEIRLGSR